MSEKHHCLTTATLLLLCSPACFAAGTPTMLPNLTNTPDGAAPGRNTVMDRSGNIFSGDIPL